MTRERATTRPVLSLLSASLVILLAACGGGGSPRAASTTAPPGAASPTTAVSGQPGGKPATPGGSTAGSARPGTPGAAPKPGTPGGATSPGAPGSPRPTASVAATKPPAVPFSGSLAKTCVSPGGTQVLRVKSVAKALVVFDTKYADNKDGQVHGGIDPYGHADDQGNYEKTWVVSPGAPVGKAIVYVGANSEGYRANGGNFEFEVKTLC